MEIIRKGWDRNVSGVAGKVSERIKSCRKALSRWKRNATCNSKKRIHELRRAIEHEEAKQFPDNGLVMSWKIELEKAYKEEETYWKEKIKNTWLKAGDKNTKVFHGWAQSRKMKNRVASLMDTDGNEHFDEERKGDIAVKYFTNLFKSSTPRSTEELLEGFEAKISERMNQTLTGPVTTGEIKKSG